MLTRRRLNSPPAPCGPLVCSLATYAASGAFSAVIILLLVMLPLPASQSVVRANIDPSRMWKMYAEYADIAVSDDFPLKSKERLNTLSLFAETEGLTGQAALEGLRCLLMDLQLLDARRFSLFYRFVFFICRERGQKSLPVNIAVEAWKLSLSGRFRLLDQWCMFVQGHQRHAISEDTWRQVLEFSRSVHEDLSNYDPEGAWPCLIDDFVDSMYRKASSSGLKACKSSPSEAGALSEDTLGGSSGSGGVGSRTSTLPGISASAGSKRRRKDAKDEVTQAESVNCIAQRLAEMPSPLSWKRVRSSGPLVGMFEPMEGVTLDMEQVQVETQWGLPGNPNLVDEVIEVISTMSLILDLKAIGLWFCA